MTCFLYATVLQTVRSKETEFFLETEDRNIDTALSAPSCKAVPDKKEAKMESEVISGRDLQSGYCLFFENKPV